MLVVAPGYLNERCLPYASDIFYHKRLLYFLPTGFHPLELHSISVFPQYCYGRSVTMPTLIWEMCNLYFENSKRAVVCLEILEPLRKQHILVATTSYPRDRTAIELVLTMLRNHPELLSAFFATDLDLPFASRELLSHVLFEIFLDEGYQGSIKYLRDHANSPDSFLRLVAAVILNRLKIFAGRETNLVVYEHSWYPVIGTFLPLISEGRFWQDDASRVEHFRYKPFETVLLPIFGRCDSKEKSQLVAKTARKRSQAIDGLKEECGTIAREVVLLPSNSPELQQRVFVEAIKTRIGEPLANLIRKPQRDVFNLIRDFTLDSTVIGGLIAAIQGATGSVVGLAATAGALSTGIKYLLSEGQNREERPSELLLDGMQKASLAEETVQKHLRAVSIKDLQLPEDWEQIGAAT